MSVCAYVLPVNLQLNEDAFHIGINLRTDAIYIFIIGRSESI